MRKIILFSLFAVCNTSVFAQTVAQDFIKTDCQAGNVHHLFAALDSQKVVIMEFVMPCSECSISGTTLEQIYQEYNFNYPGRILFFALGDNASASCSTLNTWASNGAFSCTTFSNCVADVNYYGGAGMPTVVIAGGGYAHKVFYRLVGFNGPSEDANVRAAMDSALLAANGISEHSNNISSPELFPNPATDFTSVSYCLHGNNNVRIEIQTILGETVKKIFSGVQASGNYSFEVDCTNLPGGIYFVKIISGEGEQVVKLSISH